MQFLLGMQSILLEEDTYIIDFAELPAQLIFHALMVLILFGVLGALVFKPVLKMLKKREEAIANDINSARDSKVQAAALKEQYDSKLSGIYAEREEILSDAYKTAQKRSDSIIQSAEEEAARVRERERKELSRECDKAREELKNETVDLAAEMAKRLISSSMSEEEQKKLLEDALKELEDGKWQA